MKKNYEKRLDFVRRLWHTPLIMTKLCILFLVCSMTSYTTGAIPPDDEGSIQQANLTGKVTDAANGEPQIGVTVLVKGTAVGTLTDINGNFSIPVSSRQQVTLQISFIGYTTQEVLATPGTPVNVALALEVTLMQEVVVVGYGTQKKESVVGAISQATGESLRQQAQGGDLGTAINGVLPGLISLQSTGIPGGVDYGPVNDAQGRTDGNYSQMFIRGQKTWNASSPLVLVDGVERPLNNINPYEIERISLLKDASATSVFGVKGANGVILITTYRGKEGRAKLSFDASTTAKSISKVPHLANSYIANLNKNYAIINELPITESGWSSITPWRRLEMFRDHTYPEYLPDVSWQDEFTRNFSLDQNVNMSVSGGTKLVKYYGSLAYLHEGDILNIKERGQGYDPSFEFDRINFRSNLDFDITPTTRFSANLSGSHFIQKKPQGSKWSAWYTMYQMPPDVWPVKYSDGTWANRLSFASLTNGILEFNYNGYSLAKGTDVNTDFLIEQKLDFITKGLSASAKVSFDNRMRTIGPNVDGDPPVSKWISPDIVDALEPDMTEAEIRALENDPDYVVWNVTGAGSSGYDWVQLPDSYSNETAQTASVFRSLYYQFSLNYGRDFGKHSVTGLALVSRQESASGSAFTSYREDWVGRVTYDFDNRYLLELNAAYNGSEKFSNAYRFGFFPSMAFGWIASNEPFFGILKPYVNNLKFRYSDGKVGSDEGIERWLYTGSWIVYPITTSPSSETLYRFGAPYIQNSYPFRYEGVIPNEDIHWETAHKRDLGIEAGFFDNLFLVTFDYFTENRTDIFLTGASRPVPSYYGASPVSANVGEVDVHGWEFEGKFARTTARGFNYWATFAWAYSKDKIIEGGDAPLLPAYQKKAGYQIDQPRVTLNQNEHSVLATWNDVYNRVGGTTNTNLLPGDFARLDYNADGVIDSNDQVPFGYPARPQYTYSPAVGIGWKNLTAHLRFYGVYNIEGSTGQYTGAFSNSLSILYPWDLDRRWSPENGNMEGAESPHLRVSTTGTGGYVSTPRSYLRLEGAEISYVVDGDWVRKMGLSNFRLTLSGNNLFLWSKMYEDLDFNGPSTTDGRLTYPVLKRYTFGISLNFR